MGASSGITEEGACLRIRMPKAPGLKSPYSVPGSGKCALSRHRPLGRSVRRCLTPMTSRRWTTNRCVRCVHCPPSATFPATHIFVSPFTQTFVYMYTDIHPYKPTYVHRFIFVCRFICLYTCIAQYFRGPPICVNTLACYRCALPTHLYIRTART